MIDIVTAIQAGSFPDSEQSLSQELTGSSTTDLLEEIRASKDELSQSVGTICKQHAEDVDGWIAQAKKVQQDIAQCKEDYDQIVTQYSHVRQLSSARDEARSHVGLLESEVAFNETLQKHINLLAEISQIFDRVDADIKEFRLLSAANELSACGSVIQHVASDRCRDLLSRTHTDQVGTLTTTLQSMFSTLCSVEDHEQAVEINIRPQLRQENDAPVTTTLDEVVHCANLVGGLDEICAQFGRRVTATIWHYSHRHSRKHITKTEVKSWSIELTLSTDPISTTDQLRNTRSLFQFLSDNLPDSIRIQTLNDISDALLPRLQAGWLDASIPIALDDMQSLLSFRETVKDFATWLRGANVAQAVELEKSLAQIPEVWLSKRRAASLNFVRTALKTASGVTRQVQRVETRTIELDENISANGGDDWDQDWGADDNHTDQTQSNTLAHAEVDDSNAWGFEDDEGKKDEDLKDIAGHQASTEVEESDAWGWGDDEDATVDDNNTPSGKVANKVNGAQAPRSKRQEISLAEDYTITDIPDYVLEQIGRDLADVLTLQSSGQDYFDDNSTAPTTGLQSLPTQILAMFKAIAVEHYASIGPLSRMNLYNDSLYLAEKLSERSQIPLHKDIASMSKFARSIYSAELSTQRTVLLDLLDNAQGFVSCTAEPYLSQCESAISSTTDYIRVLHTQWFGVLSASHLAQSIGSLISSVMSKMIKEIEDMEDIQESESRQLVQFMERVSALEDLFATPKSVQGSHNPEKEQENSSTITLHAPNYLRFQYLQQILDSSLADIRYMWTDAGLSEDFEADEVVDLIKALFAESSHRRSAIQAIKAAR